MSFLLVPISMILNELEQPYHNILRCLGFYEAHCIEVNEDGPVL